MRVVLILAAAALAGCATADAPATSWGKAGVGMDAFLADAAYCANSTAGVRGERVLLVQGPAGITTSVDKNNSEASNQSLDAMLGQAEAVRRAQIQADRRARQQAHDQCLAEKGYREFHLTRAQRAHVASLPEGSPERAAYLHQLGADPAVIAQGT